MQQEHRSSTVETRAPETARAPAPDLGSNAEQPGFEAQFDTDGHVFVGDSVDGASVDCSGVAFSPGEFAALMDYVGSPERAQTFGASALLVMREYLRAGCEDTLKWDEITGGLYSELSLENDAHFAPGAPGVGNFRQSFVGQYAGALAVAQGALALEEGSPAFEQTMNEARQLLYASEHYLEDAFSSGHQVASSDIQAGVDAVLGYDTLADSYSQITRDTWAAKSDVIRHYGVYGVPLNEAMFRTLATAAAMSLMRGGVYDAVRKYVHEAVEGGVEVRSGAHPEPWMLTGDHGLRENDTSLAALQAALTAIRSEFELAVVPGTDSRATAEQLFAHHCPTPTGNGARTVAAALEGATTDKAALAAAVTSALVDTIEPTLDAMSLAVWGMERLVEPEAPAPDKGAAPPPGGDWMTSRPRDYVHDRNRPRAYAV